MTRILLLAILLTLGQQRAQSQAASQSQIRGTSQARTSKTEADPSATEEPRVLEPSSPKPVPVPPFPRFGESHCDSNGNQYFAVGSNTHYFGSLLEVSHDGDNSTVFAPPTPQKLDPGGEIGYRDFAVTPSGKVYELLQNENDQGVTVVRFDSDGNIQHTTKVETPDRLLARWFTVFDDGTVLLQGYIPLKAGEDEARSFVALFDASGKLRKKLNDFPDVNMALWKTAIHDSGLVTGQDGNAYLLDANFISIVPESGENVRRVRYQKPDPALVSKGLRFSDGLIAIRLLQVNGVEITQRYMVVRADSGETIGYYALPNENHELGMCFSRSDGFTFLTRQDTKLALVNARLR